MKRKINPQSRTNVVTQVKIDVKKLLAMEAEEARPLMRTLLLANPNYFGTVKNSSFKAVLNIQSDTSYEELGCVGFQPQLNWLEAVVYVKQQTGYGGGLCSTGSQEYVRFYLSFNHGVTWLDQGMSSFTAYNIPGNGRLEYAVTLPINPGHMFCFIENLPMVRAILSWNNPPPANAPDYLPVWGNVVDAQIQIKPGLLFKLGEVLAQAKVKLPAAFSSALDLTQTLSASEPKTLTAVELQALYKEAKVPAHRFLFSEIQKQAVVTSLAQTPGTLGSLSSITANWTEIIGQYLKTDGDTGYEQLDCIGFDPNRDALVGVVRVKQPIGFLGGLCTAGSNEYVAFWIDWDDGAGWSYVGTASVTVHDIKSIPKNGLEYAVYLPVDVASRRQPCGAGAKTPQVRAILSWQTAPPWWNPDYRPTWGNRRETRIHLKPGRIVEPGTPNIAILGGVSVADINVFGNGMTFPTAKFAMNGNDADSSHRECPFGAIVHVQGTPTPGLKYRVLVRKSGTTSAGIPLTQPFWTTALGMSPTLRHPDPSTGFLSYLGFLDNIENMLGWWPTSGDDLWEIQLENVDSLNISHFTPWYRVQLDNTAPVVDIHIDSGGDCKDFAVGGTVNGHFVATDANFGSFSLSTQPNTSAFPSNQPAPTSSTSPTAPAPGNAWVLNLSSPIKMKPCGYVVGVSAWDRSITNNGPGGGNSASTSVGFCLRA